MNKPEVHGVHVNVTQLQEQRKVLFGICMSGSKHNLSVQQLASMTLLLDLLDTMIGASEANDSTLKGLLESLPRRHDD